MVLGLMSENRVGELMLRRLSCSEQELQMHILYTVAAFRGDGLRPELRAFSNALLSRSPGRMEWYSLARIRNPKPK